MGVAAGHRGYQLGWIRALEGRRPLSFEEGLEQLEAMRLRNGGPTNNADAASALVVGTGMLLGLLAKVRTGQGQYMETTMMCSNAYVVSDEFFDFDARMEVAHHDEDGAGPLYRLYRARSGSVFLAAPLPQDWGELMSALDALGAGGGSRTTPASPHRRTGRPTPRRWRRRSAGSSPSVMLTNGKNCSFPTTSRASRSAPLRSRSSRSTIRRWSKTASPQRSSTHCSGRTAVTVR